MCDDFRVKVSFFSHYKTRLLRKRAGPAGVLALLQLWGWTTINRSDGVFVGMDAESLEIVMEWEGENSILEALVSCRFVDYCAETGLYSLHDWEDHNGWAAQAADRSDASRFSRLFSKNREKALELQALGINRVSREDYIEYTKKGRSLDVRSTFVPRPVDDSITPTPTRFPVPVPVRFPTQSSKEKILSSEKIVSVPFGTETIFPSESGLSLVPDDPKSPKFTDQVRDLYNEILPELSKCQAMTDKRIKAVKKLTETGIGKEIDRWRLYFTLVRKDDWIMGRILGRSGTAFKASFDHVVNAETALKIFERYGS